jgi:hypothetical protein
MVRFAAVSRPPLPADPARQSVALRGVRAGALSPEGVRFLSATAGNRAVGRLLARDAVERQGAPVRRLQRCAYCGDATCKKGEKCQRGPDLEGLFSPGIQSLSVGTYNQAKKDSKRKQREAEHMMPKASWKASGRPQNPGKLPAMIIDYGTHHGAEAGAGGGVTSTGFSNTAQAWARLLGAKLRGTPAEVEEAFHDVATDEYNAADTTGKLTGGVVAQIVATLNLHRQQGHLTQDQAGRIQNDITDRYYEREERAARQRRNSIPAPVAPAPQQQGRSMAPLIALLAVLLVVGLVTWAAITGGR